MLVRLVELRVDDDDMLCSALRGPSHHHTDACLCVLVLQHTFLSLFLALLQILQCLE